MGKHPRPVNRELWTASELSALCEVDLKTIHNWFDNGQLQGFRTPGRHLRFRSETVRDFLKSHGYPIPKGLQEQATILVHVSLLGKVPEMAPRSSVAPFEHPYDALVMVGANRPSAVVLGPGTPEGVADALLRNGVRLVGGEDQLEGIIKYLFEGPKGPPETVSAAV